MNLRVWLRRYLSRALSIGVLLAVAASIVPDTAVRPSRVWAEADDGCDGNRGFSNFGADDRLVMTYYYYWYDEQSIANPALTLHPPKGQPFDWRDPAWHGQQFVDMSEVGVDVALAVYWGQTDPWSTGGLEAMVRAREDLLAQHLRPPAIGLMLDTNLYSMILPERPQLADLTDEEGMGAFADLVSDYFALVPVCHQARIDGRPLVFVWRADTEDGDRFVFDQRTLDGVSEMLEGRLGARPLFVFERTWVTHAAEDGVTFSPEARFGWGAALDGPRFEERTVAVGPGYDDRAIVERPGYVRDRDDGRTYARDLRAAVLSGRRWLVLETWNEFWEGTAIAETEEYGRETLTATRRYVELFHRLGATPARDGWFDLGTGEGSYLRRLADAPQEIGTYALLDGRSAARAHYEEADAAAYFQFAVDPRLGIEQDRDVTVSVEYFDEGRGSFYLEYDSAEDAASGEGVYAASSPVIFEDTGRWRTVRFELPGAHFRSRQYGGYGDFRIRSVSEDRDLTHAFGRVLVTANPGVRPVGFAPEGLAVLAGSARHAVDIRWSAIEGAAGYVIDIGPLDAEVPPGPLSHASQARDRERCAGGPLETSRVSRGISLEPSCRMMVDPEGEAGLYRWRVTGLDALGNVVGEPSDWSYLVLTP